MTCAKGWWLRMEDTLLLLIFMFLIEEAEGKEFCWYLMFRLFPDDDDPCDKIDV